MKYNTPMSNIEPGPITKANYEPDQSQTLFDSPPRKRRRDYKQLPYLTKLENSIQKNKHFSNYSNVDSFEEVENEQCFKKD